MQKYLYQDLYQLEESHWWHKAKRNLVIHFLTVNFKNKNNNKILDVGCGTGKNLEVFSKFGNTYGIDSSSEAIAFCKKRGVKNVTLGNIEKMPYKKRSFNAITALDVLEHVDDKRALREIHRILDDKGILVVTVPAFEWLWSKWDEVLYHKRRYTEETLKNILEENKFKIIKISYIYSFLVIPAIIIRTIKNLIFKNYYPSDFQPSSQFINNIAGNIANWEKFFIINFHIPFGTSLIVVAQKINP